MNIVHIHASLQYTYAVSTSKPGFAINAADFQMLFRVIHDKYSVISKNLIFWNYFRDCSLDNFRLFDYVGTCWSDKYSSILQFVKSGILLVGARYNDVYGMLAYCELHIKSFSQHYHSRVVLFSWSSFRSAHRAVTYTRFRSHTSTRNRLVW